MSIEMITALSSAILALFTLGYTVISNHKQSVLQFITAHRMESLSQIRQLLGDFAHFYRTHNQEEMMDIEARLELFIRRDIPEGQYFLNYLKHCIKSEYCEDDYEKLLSLSSFILARRWQRLKIDVKTYHVSDKTAYKMANKEVSALLDIAMSYDTKHCDQS